MIRRCSVVARFLPFRRPYLVGLGAIAAVLLILQCSSWIRNTPRPAVPASCAAWDEAAQRNLAPLTHRPQLAATTDRSLRDLLATLRRARHDCATGRLDLARRDYESLNGPATDGVSDFAQDQEP